MPGGPGRHLLCPWADFLTSTVRERFPFPRVPVEPGLTMQAEVRLQDEAFPGSSGKLMLRAWADLPPILGAKTLLPRRALHLAGELTLQQPVQGCSEVQGSVPLHWSHRPFASSGCNLQLDTVSR